MSSQHQTSWWGTSFSLVWLPLWFSLQHHCQGWGCSVDFSLMHIEAELQLNWIPKGVCSRMQTVVLFPPKSPSLNVKLCNWLTSHSFNLYCGSRLWKAPYSWSWRRVPTCTAVVATVGKGQLKFLRAAEVPRFPVCQTEAQGAQSGTCPCSCWPSTRGILPGCLCCAEKKWNPPVREKEQLWLVLVCSSVQSVILLGALVFLSWEQLCLTASPSCFFCRYSAAGEWVYSHLCGSFHLVLNWPVKSN